MLDLGKLREILDKTSFSTDEKERIIRITQRHHKSLRVLGDAIIK